MATCKQCLDFPTGSAGHDALHPERVAGKAVLFKCRNCGTLWWREHYGEATFLWIEEGVGKPRSGL